METLVAICLVAICFCLGFIFVMFYFQVYFQRLVAKKVQSAICLVAILVPVVSLVLLWIIKLIIIWGQFMFS